MDLIWSEIFDCTIEEFYEQLDSLGIYEESI